MSRSAWGLTLTKDDLDWRQRSACSPDNADWFFVTKPGIGLSPANRAALNLCQDCPVRLECHLDAATHPEPYSRIAGGQVWLGTVRKHTRRRP